jgi:hypothetical protein
VSNPEPNATVTLSPLLSFEFLSSARTARRPESRTNKKHRTELAPLLVQEFGRNRNSRSSRLADLTCSRCAGREIDMVITGTER